MRDGLGCGDESVFVWDWRTSWVDLHVHPGGEHLSHGESWGILAGESTSRKASTNETFFIQSFEMATSRAWLEWGLRVGHSSDHFSLFFPESLGRYIQPSAWSWPPMAL